MMKTTVYCKATKPDEHSFYLVFNGKSYYLFSQSYRHIVHRFFSKGIPLNFALDVTRAKRNRAITRTMRKFPMYIKYIEKEYDISVLEQTKKKKKYSRYIIDECAYDVS